MAEYFNVTTNVGDAEIANAIATNTKLNITHIAFGDGNGAVPTPTKSRTTLVREVHRQAVTKYERHKTNANWIVIETIIPSGVGGFTIREMGVVANGKLISHGSHAPFEKVADPTGVSEYRLKFTQNVRDGSVVEITLDESLIYASQAWVDENYIPRDEIIDNLITNDGTKPVSAKQAKILNESKLGKDENAISSTKLKDARKINNVSFDGTEDIIVIDILSDFSTNDIAKLKPIEVCNFIETRTNNLRLNAHYKCVNGPTDGGIFPDPYGAIEGFATSHNYCSYSWQRFSAINGGEQYIRHALNNNTWSEWSKIAKTSSNVASASKLQTLRNIAISGDGTGSTNFDGSTDVAINLILKDVNNSAGIYGANNLEIPVINLNKKGQLISAGNRQFPYASTVQYGATVLYDGIDSYSKDHAATANAVRQLGENRYQRTFSSNQEFDLARNDFDGIHTEYTWKNSPAGSQIAAAQFFRYSQDWVGKLFFDLPSHKLYTQTFTSGTTTSEWKEIAYTKSNVASASKLQNPRQIFGQTFDGTNDVNGTVTASTGIFQADEYHFIDTGRNGVDRMNFNCYTGIFNFIDANNSNIVARISPSGIDCNAASASKLQTARNIAISGDVSGSADFDGSRNIQINTSINGFDNWKSPNGYMKLPKGMILQWGTVDETDNQGENNRTVTFPIAFPNTCLNALATRVTASPSGDNSDGGLALYNTTNTTISVHYATYTGASSGSLRGFKWFAIGY